MVSLHRSHLLFVPSEREEEQQGLSYTTFPTTNADRGSSQEAGLEVPTASSRQRNQLIAITLIFVGRLGEKELAAVSLACLTANVTGWSVLEGLASALDTLCPQAYGAGFQKLVGLHTQRMALFLLSTSFPIILLWYNSYVLLHVLLQDDEICKLARNCLCILSFGCPGYALFECGKRFLRAQSHFSPGLYTFIVCIPIHVFLTWLAVAHFKLGINGKAASLSMTRNLLPFGLAICSWVFTDGECWRKVDKKIFQN
ncbi:hypothetical protein HYALB_00007773 [Hymenoscyphus albidus]|uniref:Uncharacterized protein n=1 Tax=Hymenoscyphus albidus TaxID=595503 RepID=A0A9N9LRQ7_9HELO|nr:hypothetical protein HYALB_00007773 [Hymenoscyphus albidus]